MYTGKVYIKSPWIRIHGIYGKISSKNRIILERCQCYLFFASNLHSKSKKITRSKVVIKYHKTTTHHLGEHKSRISASTRKTTGFRMAKPPGCTCDDFSGLALTICAFCVVIFLSTETKHETMFLPFIHLLKCTLEDFCWISFVVFFLLFVSYSHHVTLEPVEPTKENVESR